MAWTLSIIPHFYAVSLSKGKFSNVSPRGYLAEVQKKENKTALDKQYIRAEAAQQNGSVRSSTMIIRSAVDGRRVGSGNPTVWCNMARTPLTLTLTES